MGTIIGPPLLLLVLLVVFFDWNWLRGPLAGFLSARSGRPVRIEGNLEVAPAWSPTVTINGLYVGNPDWLPNSELGSVDRVRVTFRLMPLFIGRLILPAVAIEKPNFAFIRDATGRANWRFGTTKAPVKLPVINSLVLTDGRVTIDDAVRRSAFVGTFASHEGAALGNGRPFFLESTGTLNRRPIVVHVEGDPLLSVSGDKPYYFILDIQDDVTHILARGSITRPFDFGQMNAAIDLTGRDLSQVYFLTGIALPNTPPYELSARLVRDEENYTLDGISGRVGNTDLEGTATVDDSTDRPFVRSNLASKRLDFNDLAALFGAPPATAPHVVALPQQNDEQTKPVVDERLLPDAPLLVHRVRGTDADVFYKAASVASMDLPLRTLDVHLILDHGMITMDPVTLGLIRGQVTGRARIDARQDVPAVSTDLTLSNVHLEEFFPAKSGEPALTGEIVARAKLDGRGLSVRQAAADASGNVTVVVPHGEIRKAFAELLGIDVARGLGLLLTGDQSKADIRCAVANFRADKGVLRAQNVVLDTSVVLATGEGTINLRTEALDLKLEGHPKQLRFLHVTAPVTLKGNLRKAVVGVDAGKAVAQIGIATALGVLLTPLAAVLPFVSPGLAKDADCVALMAQAKDGAAPVKPIAATTNAGK